MKIPKREFVQLAQNFDSGKHHVGHWFVSEKLDGQRCLWDGGITRGMDVYSVPWANVDKLARFVDQDIKSTGLWTRYGQVIRAPDDWLDNLPPFPIDGELYLGRGRFQELGSITRSLDAGSGWKDVKYHIYEAPSYSEIFQLGEINGINYKKLITPEMVLDYPIGKTTIRPFGSKLKYLEMFLPTNEVVVLHEQTRLPWEPAEYGLVLGEMLEQVCAAGGEGLMIRCPNSFWTPKRVSSLLKLKQVLDAEATVIGYKAAELGKIHGRLGSLMVRYGSVSFELSGFTDEERLLTGRSREFALSNPGAILPAGLASEVFPINSRVTFKYRELTDDGIPKEARYLRKRDE